MARADIPVQIAAEQLCEHTLKITQNLNNFPKKYRYTIVDRIIQTALNVHSAILDANSSRGNERIYYQEVGIRECRKLKFYIRLCQNVLHPKCSIEYWDSLVDNIEKQLLNWKTATK